MSIVFWKWVNGSQGREQGNLPCRITTSPPRTRRAPPESCLALGNDGGCAMVSARLLRIN